jgi:hypothetical protein
MNERVPLSFLLTQNKDEHPPVEPAVPFPVLYMEDPRICTAVLERTAVLASANGSYERVAVRHDLVLVDPAMLQWRTKTSAYDGTRILNGYIEPGRGQRHRHRRPKKDDVRPPDPAGSEARAKSDERARKSQHRVEQAKEFEMRLLRQRHKPVATKEETMQPATSNPSEVRILESTIAPNAFGESTNGAPAERIKTCKRCGEDKPASEFPHSGIYGGYCSTCEPLEKADRAAGRSTTPRAKKAGKRRGRPRGVTAAITSDTPESSISHGSPAYDKIVKLLQKRDGLKAELAKVQAELQEAVG